MVNWDDIDDLDELVEKMDEDEPRFSAAMARIRDDIGRACRYLGWSDDEVRRAWEGQGLPR